jgi:hypothetical protein
MIDPATSWFEIHQYNGKLSATVANIAEQEWFSRYPWPSQVTYDCGSKFIGVQTISLIASCWTKDGISGVHWVLMWCRNVRNLTLLARDFHFGSCVSSCLNSFIMRACLRIFCNGGVSVTICQRFRDRDRKNGH